MSIDYEMFLDYVNNVFGEEDIILQHKAADGGPEVSVFVYKNLPEPGMITGVTYGLSICPYRDWKFGRPELIVLMKSLNTAWPFAAAYFAAEFRGKNRLSYGDVFTMDYPIGRYDNERIYCFRARHSRRTDAPH